MSDEERDAASALAEYDRSQPSDYERAYADPLAEALRALLCRPAQTEPTDAQVIEALNAWHQDVAAFTAGQEEHHERM